jgi:hypothetical protein
MPTRRPRRAGAPRRAFTIGLSVPSDRFGLSGVNTDHPSATVRAARRRYHIAVDALVEDMRQVHAHGYRPGRRRMVLRWTVHLRRRRRRGYRRRAIGRAEAMNMSAVTDVSLSRLSQRCRRDLFRLLSSDDAFRTARNRRIPSAPQRGGASSGSRAATGHTRSSVPTESRWVASYVTVLVCGEAKLWGSRGQSASR